MNPLKCVFGVTSGKFLGFVVHRQGIDIDPTKVQAIRSMPSPTNPKELKTFLGKVSYIRRFIPALAELSYPLQQLMKKGTLFKWGQSHEEAIQKIKEILTSPQTMTMPVKGLPMILYLTSTDKSIGVLLAQDIDGVERPVYYLSRSLQGSESNYPACEKHCLALVFATQKLRHYFLAHKVNLITNSDPIKYLLSRPALSGRIAKWLLLLSEFDITIMPPKTIKSQALADLLAHFPVTQGLHAKDTIPAEFHEDAIMVVSDGEWQVQFDGSSSNTGQGAGVVLTSPQGQEVPLAFK